MGKKAVKDSTAILMEYGADFTKYYLMVLFLALPLVLSDGYKSIAKDKYVFYMFITTTYILVEGIVYVIMLHRIIRNGKLKEYIRCIPAPMKILLIFLLSNIVTFIFAIDHKTALFGCWDWYLGLFAWLAMIVSSFFVCNFYMNKSVVWICGIVSSTIASLLVVFNRFRTFILDSQENKKLVNISTIGNTNWYCGYHMCFLAFGFFLFITYDSDKSDSDSKVLGAVKDYIPAILIVYNAILDAAAFLCGSETAFLGIGFLYFVMFGIALRRKEILLRYLKLLLVAGIVMECIYFAAFVLLKDSYIRYGMVNTGAFFKNHIGLGLIVVSILLIIPLKYIRPDKEWNTKTSQMATGSDKASA